jgi:hypothetical protein
MSNDTNEKKKRRRKVAWILILIADVIYAVWGGMAALLPEHLLGPGGKPILAAGYEGFSGNSWTELAGTSPMTAQYLEVLFRMYGLYCFIFGMLAVTIAVTAFRNGERWAWWTLLISNTIAYISAMRYDWIVNAIGPFELTEYLGLVVVYVALAITAPFLQRESGQT